MPFTFNHVPTPDTDGDVRRVKSFLRFREQFDHPHLFPASWTDEDRSAWLLWKYVREIRAYWRARDLQRRPPLRKRFARNLHVVLLMLRSIFGGSGDGQD